jgi:hypothetical protein
MAGAGTRLFIDGQILTAAQVNTYLQDQVIMRFANAATRDAAFGGVGEPTLAEGMFCYLDDTNTLQSYNGSAWVNVVSSSQPPGLQLINTTTFTNQSTVPVDNCFTSEFANYALTVNITNVSGETGIFLRMRVGGVTNANAEYVYGGFQSYTGSAVLASVNGGGTTTDWKVADQSNIRYQNTPIRIEVMSPQLSFRTSIFSHGFTPVDPLPYYRHIGGTMSVTTAYDGFSLITNSGSFTMSGTVRTYGYRNS